MMSDMFPQSYHDVMEVYKRPMSVKYIPSIFWAFISFISFSLAYPALAHAETLWVQVPQWEDDWSECAVDLPDTYCHWYVANADNTFGEGFDWESAPWFSAEGLLDVKSNVLKGLQKVG